MRCKGCGLEKDPSLFYVSNKSYCKDCIKTRSRKNRVENLERYTEYEKQRAQLHHRVQARKEYQKSDAGKVAASKAKKKYIESNPKKRSVHITTGNAIRDGKLTKGDCEVCGTSSNIVAHHCDYNKPLDVMWLCAQHHSDWHAEHGEALNPN